MFTFLFLNEPSGMKKGGISFSSSPRKNVLMIKTVFKQKNHSCGCFKITLEHTRMKLKDDKIKQMKIIKKEVLNSIVLTTMNCPVYTSQFTDCFLY